MFGFPNVVTEASIGRPAPTRSQQAALPKFTRLMNIMEVNVNIFASSFLRLMIAFLHVCGYLVLPSVNSWCYTIHIHKEDVSDVQLC